VDRESCEIFISKLAQCLAAVAPDGISPLATDGLIYFGHSGYYVEDNFLLDDYVDEDVLRRAAVATAEAFQDEASKHTRVPWPDGNMFATPDAEIVDHKLILWFGSKSDPTVRCDPIDLAKLHF
jgi:hypothetical protein